uniref:ADP-ribosylglycohydrolase n=1 Tax=Noctiluca scintillans TaxID=2966 RepID=A0A7S1B263_NOCSC|mmetsp:Transcript_9914/g.27670  ORF Transcript_9914/g.27670 Transcript_9914/m.27670 type:complete len:433 (+) Transcript_9914:41-1339(+)
MEFQTLLEALNVRADDELIKVSRKEGSLNSYSILQDVSVEKKKALVEAASLLRPLDKIMGCMVGMGVGDALGHPFEFLPVVDARGKHFFDLSTLKFHNESNTFNLKRGQWTDDAAMGLCMADSFIMRRKFDGRDMRVRFWCWWHRGYNNAFRKEPGRSGSVGLGGNISKSLSDVSRCATNVSAAYNSKTEDAGNGSLMRFAPVPVFLHCAPLDLLYDVARQSSYTTHPGIIAAEACAFFAHVVRRALESEPCAASEFLDRVTQEYFETLRDKQGWGWDQMKWLVSSTPVHTTERCWNWKADSLDIRNSLKARGHSYNGYPVSAGYFGSYCMDGLAMALWCVYHTTSFDEAVTRSVNLLGDADSHGSICGQLAGAFYGYSSINRQFVDWLARWDDHEFAVRALLLHELGSQLMTVPLEHAQDVQMPPKKRRLD